MNILKTIAKFVLGLYATVCVIFTTFLIINWLMVYYGPGAQWVQELWHYVAGAK